MSCKPREQSKRREIVLFGSTGEKWSWTFDRIGNHTRGRVGRGGEEEGKRKKEELLWEFDEFGGEWEGESG